MNPWHAAAIWPEVERVARNYGVQTLVSVPAANDAIFEDLNQYESIIYLIYQLYFNYIYYKVSPCISTMGENKPTQFNDFFGGPPEIWDFGLPTGEVGEKPPTMEDKLIQRLRRYLVSCCVLLMTCSKCLRFMKVMKVVLQRTMIYNLRLWLGSP